MTPRIDMRRLTPQQRYYQTLRLTERAAACRPGDARLAATAQRMRLNGPPKPHPRDGYLGKLAFHLHSLRHTAAQIPLSDRQLPRAGRGRTDVPLPQQIPTSISH
jgi:hypothetical protein